MTLVSAAMRNWLSDATVLARIIRDPLVLLAALSVVAAAWVPVTWFWSPATGPAPAGLDGPASWIARWWFRSDSPACFQPFVPVAALGIAWVHRTRIARCVADATQSGNLTPPVRAGWPALPILPLSLGVLTISHLTHVPSLAVAGLQGVLVGIVHRTWGTRVLRAARIPLFLLAVMTFPPETVWGMLRDIPAGWTAQSVVWTGNRLGLPWTADGSVVQTAAGVLDLGLKRCFAAVVASAGFWTLVLALARGVPVAKGLLGIGAAMGTVGALETTACVAAAILKSRYPSLSAAVVSTTAWVWFIPAVASGNAIFGRSRRRPGSRGAGFAAADAVQYGTVEGGSAPGTLIWAPVARRRLAIGSLAVLVVAMFGTWSTTRLVAAGSWLPSVPETIGEWEGTVVPADVETLRVLGNPRMVGRTYRNPFNDRVEFSLVTAGMFENYHDPTVCVGGGDYRLTATRTVPIGVGDAEARAMVFRHRRTPDHRIVMWYWQQFQDGSTDTESRMGNFRDFTARLRTGYSSIVEGKKTVIVRIFAPCDIRRDSDAGLAQFQVSQIAQAVHRHLRERR